MNTEQLVQNLSNDLSPSPQIWPFWRTLAIWLVISVCYVSIMVILFGPLRPGVETQLEFPSRFSSEMMFGIAAFVCWAIAALAQSIPGLYVRWPIWLGWLFLAIWVLHFGAECLYPSIEPSMLGKRERCVWEAYVYSIPPTLLMIWLQQRRFPLNPIRAALYAAVASATIPALAMQVACMYEPIHIITHHVFPILALTLAVGVAAFVIVRISRRSAG